jgi:hypothetical protein
MKKILHENFETTDITQVKFEDLKKKVDKHSLVSRLQYRKAVAVGSGRTIAKGEKFKFEHAHASALEDKSDLNPNFGFKCLHYSISEAFEQIRVPIINKTGQACSVRVATVEGEAKKDKDYISVDRVLKFEKG